jgi:hypothetical protein
MTFEDKIERGSFTGTTAADVVEVSLPSMSAAMVQLTGTFSATTTFEVLVDEGSSPTWKAVSATNVTTGAAATTATAAGVYSVSVAGARRFRARCSTFVSGTVVVAVNVSRGSSGGGSSSGGGGGGAMTVADGADAAQGTTTDSGIITDIAGTLIGFARGQIKMWLNYLARIPAALVGGRFDTNIGAIPGTVSTANSSAVALGGGAVFTGTSEDVSSYGAILVAVFSDQASATGGLSFQFSSDGTNWDHTRAVTIAASAGMLFSLSPNAKFFRIVYTNGATPQGSFRLQTIYHATEVTRSTSAFQDVNGTLSPTVVGQRVFADLMIQDATGNASNRMRSARDLAASPGVGGTLAAMGAGGHDGSSWRPILVSTTGQLAIGQGTVGPAKIEDAGHTTGDVGSFSLAVRQDTQSALAGTTLDYIPLTTDQNGSLRGVSGGYTTVITTTLTRPNDTTAYAAGDEMTDTGGAIQTITGAARFSGGSGIIQGIYVSQSTLWTTKPAMEIWIYDTTSTPVADNGAFAPTDGVTDTCIAVIPVTATYAGTVNQALDSGQISVPFLTSGSANLFFRIVIRNAAQDSAVSGVTKFRFRILQD